MNLEKYTDRAKGFLQSAQTVAGLKDLGHGLKSVDDPYMDFGAGQFIWRMSANDNEQGYVAASDPRRDGQAVGF